MRKIPAFIKSDLKELQPVLSSFRAALVSINVAPLNNDLLMIVQFRDEFKGIVEDANRNDPENEKLFTLYDIAQTFCEKLLGWMQSYNVIGKDYYDTFDPISISALLPLAKNFLGGNQQNIPAPPPTQPKKDYPLLYVGGGILALILILKLK